MLPAADEKGGVTLFLLVTLTGLVLFTAVLADVVHTRLAADEAESAARRAGRSMLAQFDPALLRYGLFGARNDSRNVEMALQTLLAVKREEGGSPRLRMYESKLQSSEQFGAEPLYHLGDHRIIHRQILERMKYIAGIQFGLEITQKLAKGKTQVAEARQYAEMSKELSELLKKREDALDQTWNAAQALAGSARSGAGEGEVRRQLNEFNQALLRAQSANEDVRKQLNAEFVRTEQEAGRVLPHVSVLPSSYFSEYRAGTGTIASLHAAWFRVKAAEAESEGNVDQSSELRGELQAYISEWLAQKRPEETNRQQEGRKVRQLEANHKKAAEEELNKRRDQWKDACVQANAGDYVLLTQPGGLYEKYRSYNEHAASGGMQPDIQDDDAHAFMSAALQFTGAISELAEEARDEVFVNEYALTHFTYRTYDKQKLAAAVKTGFGDQESHPLQGQEAEYILYGLPGCQLNLAAAQTELFVLRTGLRTMEALLRPGAAAGAASPMIALLAALTEGARQANQDVADLVLGEYVELPFVPGVSMNYKDHLRLFYLLHSRNESVLSRMQALIELNTGIDLTKRYTGIRVRTASVPIGSRVLRLKPGETEVVVSY